MPEILALDIHTTRWEREQQAMALLRTATEMQGHAILAGAKPDEAKRFVESYLERAAELQEPDGVYAPPRVELSPAQRRFMGSGFRSEEAG